MPYRELINRQWQAWAVRIDCWMDSLNPIFVRETRQILKGRQFVITFQFTLFGAWISALMIAASIGPEIVYQETGPQFFFAFYLALLFALHFAVPLATFLNLASEYDRNTIEMLTITSLSPRRILLGKLQSSCLQIATYASALVPFLVLTWLLGGLGILAISGSLLFGFINSLSLCAFACMLGVVSHKGLWHAFATVVLLVSCLIIFLMTNGVVGLLSNGGVSFMALSCPLVGYLFFLWGFLTVVVSITLASMNLTVEPQVPLTIRRLPATTKPVDDAPA